MKKNLLLTFCFSAIFIASFAGKFVMIPVTESHNLEILFADNDLKIHYYCDNYVLATANAVHYNNAAVLDENAFADISAYAIVYCHEQDKERYLSTISLSNKVLYSGEHFLIMKILSNDFMPAKNDGMVVITNDEAKLPQSRFDYPVITEPSDIIQNLVSQVNTDSVMGYLQTLENFGSRNSLHPNHVAARNWIKEQYEAMNLSVYYHNFNWYYGNNDNVIAIQYGTEFPDEYIVLGGHYDSYTYESQSNAPGADDNASGSSGVMETARILSQYDFKRSIIYCAFSAEEYGLYGSSAFAQKCYNEGMNILGYFNLDMTGYLFSGDQMEFYLIYPSSALTLADYFANICDIYFPTIPVSRHANMPNGDSDHTSFNQKGFKGIWWFENIDCDSPFIHHISGASGCGIYTPCTGNIPCLGDIIGPSVNSPEQVTAYTQAMVASIATLALPNEVIATPAPTNCVAEYIEEEGISVSWQAPNTNTPIIEYHIYKDNTMIDQTVELSYIDAIEDYDQHCYKITAVYDIEEEPVESGFSNTSCSSIPLPFPTNCVAEYIKDEGISISWEAPDATIPVVQYNIYKDNINTFQTNELSYLDTPEDYILHCYRITAVYNIEDEVVESDFSNQSCDSVPFIDNINEYNTHFKIYPNPTRGELIIENGELTIENVEIFDVYGRKLSSHHLIPSSSNLTIDVSHLSAGVYFIKIGNEFVGKFIKE